MAQRIFFNWKDDDLSDDLNRRTLGLIDAGLYRGFDRDVIAGMNLQLIHSVTGGDAVDLTLTPETRFGLVVTKQGGIVRDDTTIILPINPNSSGNPRIDIIYLEHEYLQIVGGLAASYGVIQGTPAATPVPPALINVNKQVILGYLFIPDGTTDLSDPTVIYTKADPPAFAGAQNLMYLDKEQTSTVHKFFSSLGGIFQTALYGAIDPVSGTLDCSIRSNYYEIPPVNSTEKLIVSLNLPVDGIPVGTPMWFFTKQNLSFTDTGYFMMDGATDLKIAANTAFMLICIDGLSYASTYKFLIARGGEALKSAYNKFTALQALEYKEGIFINSGALEHNNAGNHLFVDVTGASFGTGENVLKWIRSGRSTANFSVAANQEGGTKLVLEFNGDCIINYLESSPPSPEYKPIKMPITGNVSIKAGALVTFQESPSAWNLISVSDSEKNLLNLSRYKRFLGVIHTAVSLNIGSTTGAIRKLIVVEGSAADVDIILPSSNNTLDGDHVGILNNSNFAVNIRRAAPDGINVIDAPSTLNLVLPTARSSAELIVDKAGHSWNPVHLDIKLEDVIHAMNITTYYTSSASAIGIFKFPATALNYRNWYDPTTGYFNPKIAGWYECNFVAAMWSAAALTGYNLDFYIGKNGYTSGPIIHKEVNYTGGSRVLNVKGTALIYFDGNTDYAFPNWNQSGAIPYIIDSGSITWKLIRQTP